MLPPMFKRLVDAVVHGFGARAGGALFDHALQKAAEPEPTEAERRAAEETARKAAEAEAKRLEREGERAAAARREAADKSAKEVDRELAAMKKKLGKS